MTEKRSPRPSVLRRYAGGTAADAAALAIYPLIEEQAEEMKRLLEGGGRFDAKAYDEAHGKLDAFCAALREIDKAIADA